MLGSAYHFCSHCTVLLHVCIFTKQQKKFFPLICLTSLFIPVLVYAYVRFCLAAVLTMLSPNYSTITGDDCVYLPTHTLLTYLPVICDKDEKVKGLLTGMEEIG